MPLPETLCHTGVKSHEQPQEPKEAPEQTYEEKKKFWERMSSSDSISSSISGRDAKKSPQQDYPDPLIVQAAVPRELPEEEVLQQISPEKKSDYDTTFSAPTIASDDDGKEMESLEEKQIPLNREDVSIDRERLVTMQIREGIIDSELEHHEESVMTSESLFQEAKEISADPQDDANLSRVVFVTAPSIEESSSASERISPTCAKDLPAPDAADVDAKVLEGTEKPRKNSLLTSDPVAGAVELEEVTKTRRLSREEATEIAHNLLSELETQAMEQVKVLRQSQEELDVATGNGEDSAGVHQSLTEAANNFVADIEKKAVEIVERLSQSSQENLLEDGYQNGKPEEPRQEREIPVQISMDISDSDLKQADIGALRDEFDLVRGSTSSGSPSTIAAGFHQEEISDTDLKAEGDERAHHELHQQLTDMMEESRNRDTFHQMSYTENFWMLSSFRSHLVSWFGPDHITLIPARAEVERQTIEGQEDDFTAHHGMQQSNQEIHSFNQIPDQTFRSQEGGAPMDTSAQSEDIWAEEARHVKRDVSFMREKKSDNESSSSVSKTKTDNRTSGTDYEGFLSSGDNYVTATEGQSSNSRLSSDVETLHSAMSGRSSTMTTTEYETAHSSRDVSAKSTTDEYHTAASSLTSKECDISESSGNLGSIEVTDGHTDCDDSLLDVAIEDRDMITPTGPLAEEEEHSSQRSPHVPGTFILGDTTDTENEDARSPEIMPNMKRSHEMVFGNQEKGAEETQKEEIESLLTVSSTSEATILNPTADGSATLPRVVSFETNVVSYEVKDPYQMSQQSFDAEMGSRPESELKNLISRPQSISEAMLSRDLSDDRCTPKSDVSDTEACNLLKTNEEPFDRPISPEPPREVFDAPNESSDAQPESELPVITSPPLVSKQLEVKYFPPEKEVTHEEIVKKVMDVKIMQVEIEEKKQWLEDQFDDGKSKVEQAVVQEESEEFFYSQPLDQIVEEDENCDERELMKLKQTLKQAGEFSTKKFLIKNERDDISMSSLQEFEKLEQDLAGRRSRDSTGSQDSLEAGPIRPVKKIGLKGDEISVDSSASLLEFEGLEKACKEADKTEKVAKEQEEVLSEIEEGHESQISEATDSGETLSDAGQDSNEDNSDDFEERMFQIDEIIKQAQTNVEQFQKGTESTDSKVESSLAKPVMDKAEMLPLEEILGRPRPTDTETESTGVDRTASAGSSHTDSLEGENHLLQENIMETSADSLDFNGKKASAGIMQTSADSLEGSKVPNTEDMMLASTDSIENDRMKRSNGHKMMEESTDSLEGNNKTAAQAQRTFNNKPVIPPVMAASTDSLEDSQSFNTKATASLMSSATSDTFVADLDHDGKLVKGTSLQNQALHEESDETSISSKDTVVDVTHSQVSFGHSVKDAVMGEFSSHVVERTVEMPAQLSRVKFTGPDADKKMMEYMEQLGGGDVQETEYVDDKGNVVSKKVVQQTVIIDNGRKKDKVVVDEHGNVPPIVHATNTIEVIAERRRERGMSHPNSSEIFKAPPSVVMAKFGTSFDSSSGGAARVAAAAAAGDHATAAAAASGRAFTGIFGCNLTFVVMTKKRATKDKKQSITKNRGIRTVYPFTSCLCYFPCYIFSYFYIYFV